MDNNGYYEWRDNELLQQTKLSNGSFKICVDGGFREHEARAAIAFTVYSVSADSSQGQANHLVWMGTQIVRSMSSAFQTEATALEWTLSLFLSFLRERCEQPVSERLA